MLRLGIEDGVYARLTSLTSNFLLYFLEVNWVHDNDVIRTIFAQKLWRNNSLTSTWNKFAHTVRIYVDDVFHLIMHPNSR